MFDVTVTRETATRIETTEVHAWEDMYLAAPAEFARRFQLEILRNGALVLTRCKPIPFVHFNCVMNLGVDELASERRIDELLALYRSAGVTSFAIFHTPASRPAELPRWLEARGLRRRGGWDRVYRDDRAAPAPIVSGNGASGVEKVGSSSAEEWADFIDATYGLPTKPWLLSLVERPGWHHYLLRRDGVIAAVRSMYVDRTGDAWLGIDAPVPGIMAPSFDLDQMLCRAIVGDGLASGVRSFAADIEAPSPDRGTPAYRNFAALGFRRPYFRHHYCAA